VKLLSCFAQYLMDLRLLFRSQLKRIKHLLKALLSGSFAAAPAPSLVAVQSERAGREAEKKNYQRSNTNLPFAFVNDVHILFSPPILLRRKS
jgi:hypothetical protein